MEMSRLTRDGIAERVSRDQTLRRERGQGKINFPCSADYEQDRQPYPVDPYPCYIWWPYVDYILHTVSCIMFPDIHYYWYDSDPYCRMPSNRYVRISYQLDSKTATVQKLFGHLMLAFWSHLRHALKQSHNRSAHLIFTMSSPLI